MMEPPIPADEPERLAALHALRLLDTPPEERFDRITRTARDLFHVPISLISLVDTRRQWFKSASGLDERETPRAVSFCGHAILGDAPMVVEDAAEDMRFADNPLVAGHPFIRFYAGMPLRSRDGRKLGTLCLIGREPRPFSAAERARLGDIAAWAERELNLALEMENSVAEMRETFVRLVSHELRTPVTSLMGALDLIRDGLQGGDEIVTLAEIAKDGAGQLKRVVDRIVALAELDAGEVSLARTRVAVSGLLNSVADSAATSAQRNEVRIAVEADPGLVFDMPMKPVEKIVGCLLDNAIRFSGPGQKVRLRGDLSGQCLRIAVEDSGPSIPEEERFRLFQPFAQGNAADNRRLGGLGIGLSLSQRLATAVGGKLGYETREQGGSRFYLVLPGITT